MVRQMLRYRYGLICWITCLIASLHESRALTNQKIQTVPLEISTVSLEVQPYLWIFSFHPSLTLIILSWSLCDFPLSSLHWHTNSIQLHHLSLALAISNFFWSSTCSALLTLGCVLRGHFWWGLRWLYGVAVIKHGSVAYKTSTLPYPLFLWSLQLSPFFYLPICLLTFHLISSTCLLS